MRRRAAITACLVVLALSAGCLFAGDDTGQQPTEVTPTTQQPTEVVTPTTQSKYAGKLTYRLVVEPVPMVDTTANVTITNAESGDVVFDQAVNVTEETDLSQHIEHPHRYDVSLTVAGNTTAFTIHDYEGYKLFVNETNVVKTHMEVI